MALKAVKDAVEIRLDLGFDGCPRVASNAAATTDPANGAFYTVQYPVANSEQVSIGAPGQNVWREEGAFRIVISEQRGVGTAAAYAWAEAIARLFRGIQIVEPDCTLNCWAPGSPVEDDGNADGSFYLLSFAVPYTADIVG